MKLNLNLQKFINVFTALFFFFLLLLGFFAVATPDEFWHASFVINKGRGLLAPFDWSLSMFQQWSGRIFVNFLTAIFTVRPDRTNLISALNAMLFFGSLVFYHSDFYNKFEKERSSRIIFAAVQVMMLFILGYLVLGEAVYKASTHYVWPFVFFVFANSVLKSDLTSKYSWMKSSVFYVLGNSIEFMIFPGLFILIQARQKIPQKYFWQFLGAFLVGVALNVFAPGFFPIVKSAVGSVSLYPMDLLYYLQVFFMRVISLSGLNILLALPLAFFFRLGGIMNLPDIKQKMIESYLLAFTSVFIAIPATGPIAETVYFYFLIFFSMAVFWTVQYLKRRFFEVNVPILFHQMTVLFFLFGGSLVLFLNAMDAASVRGTFLTQQELIAKVSKKEKNLISSKFKEPMKNHLLFYTDLSSEPEAPANEAQAEYYELQRIIAE